MALSDESLVQAVLDDYRTAPIGERLRAVLGYLEKLTLHPDEIEAGDVAPLRAAGVSDAAIEDAVHICANFNLINRLGDALGFEIQDVGSYQRLGQFLLEKGYK